MFMEVFQGPVISTYTLNPIVEDAANMGREKRVVSLNLEINDYLFLWKSCMNEV
jgi:hypothetical protein